LKLASLGGRFITSNLNTSGFRDGDEYKYLCWTAVRLRVSIADGYDLGKCVAGGIGYTGGC